MQKPPSVPLLRESVHALAARAGLWHVFTHRWDGTSLAHHRPSRPLGGAHSPGALVPSPRGTTVTTSISGIPSPSRLPASVKHGPPPQPRHPPASPLPSVSMDLAPPGTSYQQVTRNLSFGVTEPDVLRVHPRCCAGQSVRPLEGWRLPTGGRGALSPSTSPPTDLAVVSDHRKTNTTESLLSLLLGFRPEGELRDLMVNSMLSFSGMATLVATGAVIHFREHVSEDP